MGKANISANDPKTGRVLSLQRHSTNELQAVNRGFRSGLERSAFAKRLLKVLAIVGICLIMAGMNSALPLDILGTVSEDMH